MRAILIRLADALIQFVLLYVAFRLCQTLLERAFLSAIGSWESPAGREWSRPSLTLSRERYCLSEKSLG
jgi:hypothetical protein